MTKYVCKCGRIVNKSTKADNTGNRDTAGCDGCPYLLPWGPFQWDETRHAMVTEIKGYECRMSPTLNYATYYQGSGADKCVLHIYSLDYDFLERVAAWTAEHFPDKEISCNFSRDKIRAVEFIGGLYRMSVYPVQNKKGIAAKAALLEHFFDGNGARKDMTPDEEKARILAAIEDGKAQAQKKETNQMNPIISENLNNGGTYAYYAGRFWVYGKTANEWFVSDLAAEEYQKARDEDEDLTPEDFMASSDVFVQMEDWEITTEMVNSLMRTAESVHPQHADEPEERRIGAGEELIRSGTYDRARVAGRARAECGKIEVLHVCPQKPENIKIWLNAMMPPEYWVMNKSGNPCGEHIETCPYCGAALKDRYGDVLVVPYDVAAESQHEVENAASTQQYDSDANPTQAAPASPADAGAAEQSPSDAEAVSLAAGSAPEAFDYTGLDEATQDTLHWAEREIGEARRDYIARLAQAVYIAHDALCGSCDNLSQLKHGNRGDATFGAWCSSVGLSRKTAERLLQVNALLSGSTPEEQAALEAASPSMLYAAAKPSAPAELVQAVKDGDITTHKQYQDALAEIRARDAKIRELMEISEDAARRADEARAWAKKVEHDADLASKREEEARAAAHKYHVRVEEVEAQRNALLDQQTEYIDRIHELESRPVEVAVQEPTEEQIAAAAKQRTAMIEAQLHSVQEQLDDALDRVSGFENGTYMAAAAFANNAAMTIDSIRTAFWALAAELPEEDFADAVTPLDEAVRRIYDREWEDAEE